MERIYLDTSVVSAYFDIRIPYQRDLTREWWDFVKFSYELCLSAVTVMELERVDEPKKTDFLGLIKDVPVLEVSGEIEELAESYVKAGIVPVKYLADAFHLAYATYYKIDYFVTWNCSHFANVNKRRKIRLFNTAAGLFTPEIVTPEFFMEVEK